MATDRWAVALDGGTTNTRARLLRGAAVVAVARRGVGARDGPGPLAAALRDALAEVRRAAPPGAAGPVVAAGMLSSEAGLGAVPHVPAPAGLDDLARGAVERVVPEVGPEPILFVPGVRTPPAGGPDGWAEADVMRGEECETFGAWLALGRPDPPPTFLWPGSHTKLVALDDRGRIARSTTTLAGELAAAVARHTLLAASLPAEWPEAPDPDAMALGARMAAREGLGRAGFLVRLAALTDALGPEARVAFWLGAVAADDIDHLARHPILARPGRTLVGGRQPLRSFSAALLAERLGRPVEVLDDDLAERASALGALAVADRRAELGIR